MQLAVPREQYDQVVAERDYWKAEAKLQSDTRRVDTIRAAFALTASEAWLLDQLYKARGEMVSLTRLDEDRPYGKRWDERENANNTIAVFVSRLRGKLGREAILTRRSHGYALSPETVERMDGIFA